MADGKGASHPGSWLILAPAGADGTVTTPHSRRDHIFIFLLIALVEINLGCADFSEIFRITSQICKEGAAVRWITGAKGRTLMAYNLHVLAGHPSSNPV